MKKALLIVCFAASLNSDVAHAQTFSIRDIIKIDLSGYIKYEGYADSRQIISLRENQYLLYPKNRLFDVNDNDINSVSQLNMSVIESRARGEITCHDIWNGKPHGVFEADFFGTGNTIELFRIRHAYGEINWKRFSLLAGQTWHPMFVADCSPKTVGFNTGSPMQPFSRDPQIRGTFLWKNFEILCAALTQLEVTSDGPDGPSTKYIINAIVPNLHWQFKGKIKNHRLGFGIDFKRLVPRLETNKGIKVTESLSSIAATFYSALNWDVVAFKMALIYGQNTTDLVMLGGYAVKSVNPETDFRKYTTLKNISFWCDFFIKKTIEPGIFVGVTKNLGAHQRIIQTLPNAAGIPESTIYARNPDIDHVFRISPRVRWHMDPVQFAAELELTRATYGTIATNGNVINGHSVNNLRFMFATYYRF